MSSGTTLKIGQVAQQAGVGVETVRFYERKGLIDEPPRRSSGYRAYPAEVVRRIHFIKRSQELGFSLNEIGELLALRVDPQSTCGDVKLQAEAKMADIEAKIRSLQRMKRTLKRLSDACGSGKEPSTGCPILDAIDKPSTQ